MEKVQVKSEYIRDSQTAPLERYLYDAELQTRETGGEASNVHYITLTASAIRYV